MLDGKLATGTSYTKLLCSLKLKFRCTGFPSAQFTLQHGRSYTMWSYCAAGVFCRQDSYRLIILVTVNSDSCFCAFSYKGNLTLLHANTLTLPAGSFLRKKFINIKYKNNIERKCVYNQQEHLAKLLILRHLKQISLKVRVSSTSKTIRNTFPELNPLITLFIVISSMIGYTWGHLLIFLLFSRAIFAKPPTKTWTSYTPDSLIDRRIWNFSTKPSKGCFTFGDISKAN